MPSAKHYTPEDDEIIESQTDEEAAKHLKRSKNAIRLRRLALRKKKKDEFGRISASQKRIKVTTKLIAKVEAAWVILKQYRRHQAYTKKEDAVIAKAGGNIEAAMLLHRDPRSTASRRRALKRSNQNGFSISASNRNQIRRVLKQLAEKGFDFDKYFEPINILKKGTLEQRANLPFFVFNRHTEKELEKNRTKVKANQPELPFKSMASVLSEQPVLLGRKGTPVESIISHPIQSSILRTGEFKAGGTLEEGSSVFTINGLVIIYPIHLRLRVENNVITLR